MGDTKIAVKLENTNATVTVDEETATAIMNEMEETKKQGEQKDMDKKEEMKSKEEEAKEKMENAAAEIASLKAELENTKGELETYKTQLENALNPENIAAAAQAMISEKAEAKTIIANSRIADGVDEKELSGKIENCHGIELKTLVMNSIGVNTEGMSDDAVCGAFRGQSQICNSVKGQKKVAGTKIANSTVEAPKGRTYAQSLGF